MPNITMKLLTVSALLCALMALTSAAASPSADNEEEGSTPTEESPSSFSSYDQGWTQYENRCFIFFPTPMTWAVAESYCKFYNGHLASVHNDVENKVIQELTAPDYPPTWIGGTDAAQDNFWFWSDGSPFRYSYWCPEPTTGSAQHCLEMNFSGAKCWNAERCELLRPFVCAKNME